MEHIQYFISQFVRFPSIRQSSESFLSELKWILYVDREVYFAKRILKIIRKKDFVCAQSLLPIYSSDRFKLMEIINKQNAVQKHDAQVADTIWTRIHIHTHLPPHQCAKAESNERMRQCCTDTTISVLYDA